MGILFEVKILFLDKKKLGQVLYCRSGSAGKGYGDGKKSGHQYISEFHIFLLGIMKLTSKPLV